MGLVEQPRTSGCAEEQLVFADTNARNAWAALRNSGAGLGLRNAGTTCTVMAPTPHESFWTGAAWVDYAATVGADPFQVGPNPGPQVLLTGAGAATVQAYDAAGGLQAELDGLIGRARVADALGTTTARMQATGGIATVELIDALPDRTATLISTLLSFLDVAVARSEYGRDGTVLRSAAGVIRAAISGLTGIVRSQSAANTEFGYLDGATPLVHLEDATNTSVSNVLGLFFRLIAGNTQQSSYEVNELVMRDPTGAQVAGIDAGATALGKRSGKRLADVASAAAPGVAPGVPGALDAPFNDITCDALNTQVTVTNAVVEAGDMLSVSKIGGPALAGVELVSALVTGANTYVLTFSAPINVAAIFRVEVIKPR